MSTVPPDETPDSTAPSATPPKGGKARNDKRRAGLGSWAMTLGILGIIFALIPHTSGFGIFLGVVALLLGGIALLRKRDRARPGAILGALALILGIVFLNVYSSSATNTPTVAASTTPSPAAAAPSKTSTPKQPAGTASELQALAAAKGYLASSIGFSQASLTGQLTSSAGNGFSQADAQWAVAHADADWNAQAVTAAKGYLVSGTGFSQASLTGQLTSASGNQFTPAQAAYAVANSGADWNAQAVIAAKGYLKSGIGFSRQSLIDQLTSAAGNQFTADQATYAADQVGLK